jgi:hypothetical protein
VTNRHISAGLDLNETEESLCGLEYPDEVDYSPTAKGAVALD